MRQPLLMGLALVLLVATPSFPQSQQRAEEQQRMFDEQVQQQQFEEQRRQQQKRQDEERARRERIQRDQEQKDLIDRAAQRELEQRLGTGQKTP